MEPLLKAAGLALAALLGACGDDTPACDLAQANDLDYACRDAMIIALRETSTLVPSDQEIGAVYEFLEKVRPLACYFDRTVALYEYGSPWQPVIASTNPVLVGPWSEAEIETGDPIADALFVDRGAYRVFPPRESDQYMLWFDKPLNWDVLAQEVEALADTQVVRENVALVPNDIRRARAPSGDAWIVTFVFAWGDCFLGCDGSHQWDVRVPDDGSPPVILGDSGDEIPAALRCPGE